MAGYMQWLNVVRVSGLAAIGFLAVACKPSEPLDPAGQVSLTFEGLRNDGMSVSDVFFILENRSTRPIYFQATKAFWSSTAYPVYTAISCTDADPSRGTSASTFPLVDFWGGPPPFIEISPGDRLRLNIADHGNDIAQHRGGTCRLRLQLKGDNVIESKPFHPIITF
jgi:hypothetical protein